MAKEYDFIASRLALRGSIKHWRENLAIAESQVREGNNCHINVRAEACNLCVMFQIMYNYCVGCPVAAQREPYCKNTPYFEVIKAKANYNVSLYSRRNTGAEARRLGHILLEAIKKEIEFLESLRITINRRVELAVAKIRRGDKRPAKDLSPMQELTVNYIVRNFGRSVS